MVVLIHGLSVAIFWQLCVVLALAEFRCACCPIIGRNAFAQCEAVLCVCIVCQGTVVDSESSRGRHGLSDLTLFCLGSFGLFHSFKLHLVDHQFTFLVTTSSFRTMELIP